MVNAKVLVIRGTATNCANTMLGSEHIVILFQGYAELAHKPIGASLLAMSSTIETLFFAVCGIVVIGISKCLFAVCGVTLLATCASFLKMLGIVGSATDIYLLSVIDIIFPIIVMFLSRMFVAPFLVLG